MTALDLLRRLHKLDIRLIADGEKLRVNAPKDAMTDEVREQIRAHKAELLRVLLDANRDGGTFIEPVGRLEPIPLSSQQQRLWFISQLQPDSPAYNISSSIRLEGDLNIEALKRALDALLDRHEVLRAALVLQDGQPMQIVQPAGPMDFGIEDVSMREPAARMDAWRRIVSGRGQRSFDLSKGPMLRAFLTRFDDRDHILTCTMHHIASDGWSVSVMYRDLAALYSAFAGGTEPDLPDLPIQYPDFAAWQRKRLDGPALKEMVGHWERALDDISGLELPTDRARPAIPSWKGAAETITIPADVVNGLERTARAQNASKFMVLLAVYDALLSRLTGQDDIVVGSPIAGRDRTETEGLIGFFINTLVMRTDTTGDPTFEELVSRVRATALDAYSHQDVPFEKIVERVAPDRDISRNPIFQTTFALQNVGGVAMTLPGLKVTPLPPAGGTTRFDLETHVSERADGGLSVGMVYSTDLFNAETIRQVADRFARVASACAENPGVRLSELPLLLEDERDMLLRDWGRSEREYPRDETIVGRFERCVDETPDAIALEYRGTRLSYGEVNRRANRLAHRLSRAGVKPDTLVGLCIDRTHERVISILAILKAGGAYAPIDPGYPRSRIEWMLEDMSTPVVVTERAHEAIMPTRTGTEVLVIDAPSGDCSGERETNPGVALEPTNLAYLNYTSGSTGTPKGVMIPHRAVMRLVFSQGYIKFGPDKVFLHMSAISFDASTLELWGPLLHGGRLVLPDEDSISAEILRDAFENRGVTSIFITTALFNTVIESDPTVFEALTDLLVGGDALSVPIIRAAMDVLPDRVRIVNAYGPTESTTFTNCYEIPRTLQGDELSVPIGPPISNTRVYVLDKYMRLVPPGVVGELYVGGDGVARGYLNRPEVDAERFIELPQFGDTRVYRTGDLVRWTRDGLVEFLGRTDAQIKIRGYRIELGEIENAIRVLPGVREAIVLCRQDTPGVKRLVAYVTANEGDSLTAPELSVQLSERLPSYMVPSVFMILDAMPLTATGKLNRRALPEPEASAGGASGNGAPTNDTEHALVEVWQKVLKRENIGIHDNFFELGGESILSIQVVSRARENGIHLTPRHLFQHQTIAELAAVASADASATDAEQGAVTGPIETTPIVAWFFDQNPIDAHHFNQAFVFELRKGTRIEQAQRSLDAVMTHHDALRLRVNGDGSSPEFRIADTDSGVTIEMHDLSSLDAARRAVEIERISAGAQASLDLKNGPIVAARWFDMGTGERPRLMLAAHHLAVDIVSWHILMEDLAKAIEQSADAKPITLPAKTSSFKSWAARMKAWASSEHVLGQSAYWLEALRDPDAFTIPMDRTEGENTVESVDVAHVMLDADDTRILLEDLPRNHHAQINESLLAALSEALAEWTGRPRTVIDLEGHGREELFDDIDLSRTVGWFTSIYPFALEHEPSDSPGDTLAMTRERLRAIPDKGVGFGALRYLGDDAAIRSAVANAGEPAISFNYAGKFEGGASSDATLRFARESAGPIQSPRSERAHLIDITGSVSGGRLRLALHYSANRHDRSTIERLGALIKASIGRLTASAEAPARLVPSDFPGASLTQTQLDEIAVSYADIGIEDIYTLTPLQRVMLFQTISAPRSGVFVTQFAFTLRGAIDTEALRSAWRQTVDDTPVLRTGYAWRHVEEMHQIVARTVPLPWIEADLREHAEAKRKLAIAQYLKLDRAKGFDMTRPPLMRVAMVRISEDETMMVWTHHHSLLDGWSVPQLLTDVFTRYQAVRTGGTPAIQPRAPFSDHLAWMRHQDKAAADAFWIKLLGGMTHATSLVIDANPGALPGETERVEEQIMPLSREDSDTLASFAQKQRLTVNSIMQGAWALLLSRYSGDPEVTYGVIVSGRPADLPGSDRIVGMFINGLPMRARIEPEKPSGQWLREIQDTQSEMRQYEYSALTDIAGLIGFPRGTPMFNTTVVFENYPKAEGFGSSSDASGIAGIDVTANTNSALHLRILPGERLTLRLVHDVARFDAPTATRMLEQLHHVVMDIAKSDGQAPLGDLSFHCPSDARSLPDPARALDATWRGPIHGFLTQHAAGRPDAMAVKDDTIEWSYRQLESASNRIAHKLIESGVEKGDRVAIIASRSAPIVACVMGVLKSGAAYFILDPAYPAERMVDCAEIALPNAVLAMEAAGDLPEVFSKCLDAIGCDARISVPRSGVIDSPSDTDPGVEIGPDDIAVVTFTSGSTGKPKGVMGRHGPLTHFLPWMREKFALSESDRFSMLSALAHDPLQRDIFTPIQLGAAVCIPSTDTIGQPGAIARWMLDYSITVAHLTPAMCALVTEDPSAGLVTSLRRAFFVGDVLTNRDVTALYRLAPNVQCINMYGSTETQRAVTYCEVLGAEHTDESLRPFPIGVGMEDAQIVILDASDRRVGAGEVGEVYFRSPHLAKGYLGDAKLTGERFVQSPFASDPDDRLYRTGDRGAYFVDGGAKFAGRRDHQVKIRGFRVELGEIESAIKSCDGIKECVVTLVGEDRDNKLLAAYFAGATDPTSLRNALRNALPAHMIPAAFVPMPALPKTATGKVDRAALPAPDQDAFAHAAEFVAPSTPTEEAVAQIWADLLKRDRVGAHDNFFDIGGHSLMATRMVSMLRDSFGVDVSLRRVFESPTVSGVAMLVEEALIAEIESMSDEEAEALMEDESG